MEQMMNRVFLLILSLLASASSQQTLQFQANSGEGRYVFAYPEFGENDARGIESGNLPAGLFRVECHLGGSPSSTIRYLSEGGDGGVFQVDEITGAIALQDGMQLDYEVETSYQFGVLCSAPTSVSNATTQVDFTVLPVNEFLPVLSTGRNIRVIVREDTPIGEVLLSPGDDTFSATDEDDGPDGQLSYSLSSENIEMVTAFSVGEGTGILRVAQKLDVDNTPTGFDAEVIRLTVCDSDPPIPECPNVAVSVFILAVNDNSPTFSQDVYRVSMLEDVPFSSTIANVSCTDADVGVGSFDRVSSSDRLFNVTVNQIGQTILLNGKLDFETNQVHNVSLTCSDTAGNTSIATLLVTVEPVNDNEPQFTTDEYFFTMRRILTTGNEIGRVVAVDRDEVVGADLTYTMTENVNFQIQSDGTIILTDFVYVIEGQTFTLDVVVSDGKFSNNATVIIIVTGVLSVPEIILTCMGALIFLALVVFLVVAFFYCRVCCSRLIPKQRIKHVEVEVPVMKNENAMPDGAAGMVNIMPIAVPVLASGMYNQGKNHPYMVGQIPTMMGSHWGSQSMEEEASEEEDADLGSSVVTASSRVYSPTPYLKEMLEMFKEGDELLQGKKKSKKK